MSVFSMVGWMGMEEAMCVCSAPFCSMSKLVCLRFLLVAVRAYKRIAFACVHLHAHTR